MQVQPTARSLVQVTLELNYLVLNKYNSDVCVCTDTVVGVNADWGANRKALDDSAPVFLLCFANKHTVVLAR